MAELTPTEQLWFEYCHNLIYNAEPPQWQMQIPYEGNCFWVVDLYQQFQAKIITGRVVDSGEYRANLDNRCYFYDYHDAPAPDRKNPYVETDVPPTQGQPTDGQGSNQGRGINQGVRGNVINQGRMVEQGMKREITQGKGGYQGW